ncbi:type VI secretion system lipoprotein TssJ [Massilia dura]|uniref:Type VI secretion system lipoprotein TssJ n=1 Tax=Pseudoduganella dura TaxID=321982 RepID=A0A6I3XMX2_9BURK|nr:type VI secretion system lipoprotein TssJ [Pseudoduganella dura]MUI15051.1 type VI secretion system lipoprotein TssJ [Pseudoduganella dura]GGY02165.1 type VI secretion system-associated lipoprotein [Pseudoduganella dura]
MKAIPCIAAAAAAAVLAGCGTASIAGAVLQIAGVNRPPELPDAQKPARNVNIRLHAAPTLNSGNGGPPLALVARIYKLRQAEAFERVSYGGFASAQAERELLGPDLLEVKEVLLIPGQRYEVTEKVSREAGYVGVVALFRAPDGQRWRAAFPTADAEKAGITIGLHACAMTIGQGAAARQPQVARPLAQAQCA